MILIISNELDRSTDKIIDWLTFFNCKYFRLNKEDSIKDLNIEVDNTKQTFNIKTKNYSIHSDEVSAVWYRKNSLEIDIPLKITKNILRRKRIEIKKQELSIIKEYIEYILFKKKILGKSLVNKKPNKLTVLDHALKLGFNIPKTTITTNRNEIPSGKLISKTINDVYFLDYPKILSKINRLITYTVAVPQNIKNVISEKFFPTLFQDRIDKLFEIRVFHINGINYSMAIFSQKNTQTQIDFRKYDYSTPNRTVPYKLTNKEEERINKLMNILNYDTGSIDLIYDKKGLMYFLEVNPVGQFGMVSNPCNYYLEREIAQTLKSMNT